MSRFCTILVLFVLYHGTFQGILPTSKSKTLSVAGLKQHLLDSGITKGLEKMDNLEMKKHALDYLGVTLPKPQLKLELAHGWKSMGESPLVDYTTPQMVTYYGYPVETHMVVTDDGYILEIHRIPHGKSSDDKKTIGEPVIVQHGLFSSSSDWTSNPPSQAIAYMLSDAGYDVWLPNVRGNTYSRGHTTLNNKKEEFWNFSWHEMGEHDLPTIIDYVLEKTGYSQVYYAAHSMGTTMFFTMMDTFPEYNDKIHAMFAMAPVTSVDDMMSPLHYFSPFVSSVIWWLDLMNIYEFVPSEELEQFLATWFCDDGQVTQFICTNMIFILGGYNEKQLNTTMLPVYLSHMPAGASIRTLAHYGQTLDTALFRKYDYGEEENVKIYGNTAPPLYDLGKTKVPTYFYWGRNDWMTSPKDVAEAASKLPNLKLSHEVADKEWTHFDFMWGIQANTMVYAEIIKELNNMTLPLKN